jgi:[ribosomal protein S5]-alanine N-acetyltransferase
MYLDDIFTNFPVLDIDDNFILREQTTDDTEDFFQYYADPEVSKYILSSIPTNIEESRVEIQYWINLYNRKSCIYWAVARKSDNKMIGAIGYNDWNRFNNRAEISYDLAKEYWGQGLMSKAMSKIIEFGFINLHFNRIQASTIKVNKSSIKILERNGFTFEGKLKQYRYHQGKYFDIEMFGFTRDEYLKQNPKKNMLLNPKL